MSLTIEQAIDNVLDERRARQDFSIPLKDFTLSLDTDGKNIVGVIDGQDYTPTEHCLKQMAKWHNLPLGILKNLTAPITKQNGEVIAQRDSTDLGLLVQLFKNGIRDGRTDPNKVFKFRTYNGNTLRAMLSDMYAIIDNVWYLECLQGVFKGFDSPPQFEHWNTDGDSIHGNLRIPGIESKRSDSDYGGMLFIGNCEIGTRRIAIAPAVWRQICTNGMMGWAKGQEWNKVHRGDVDLKGLASSIQAQINNAIPILADGIDRLTNTQALEFSKGVKPSQLIAQIADNYKMTTGEKGQAIATVAEYVNHESNFRNLFGIINAITRVAQTQIPAEHHRLEEIGGDLTQLTPNQWERLNNVAAYMPEERYNKILGRVAA